MNYKNNNNLFVISAPSGAGKTTIINELLSLKELFLSKIVTCTTRIKRDKEIDGIDYKFISNDNFNKFVSEEKFIEYSEVYRNFYGVLTEDVHSIGNKIISLDLQGVKKFKEKNFSAIYILILPPNFDELKKRLLNRKTENQETIQTRLNEAEEELKQRDLYDYIVVNDDLEKAVTECKEIIIGEINNEEKK